MTYEFSQPETTEETPYVFELESFADPETQENYNYFDYGARFEQVRVPEGDRSTPTAAANGLRMESEGPVVFNHDVGRSYDDLSAVSGVELYNGRVLGATQPGDIVHLSPAMKEDYGTVMEHYKSVGLECATDVVWDMEPQPTPEGYKTSSFLFESSANQANPDEARLKAVQNFNSKNWLADMAKEEGYDIPQTDTYKKGETPEQTFDGPWFVKGDVAASGTQVVKCESWDAVVSAAENLGENYQVQQGVGDDAVFLSVQYKATKENGVEFIATSEQVLNGFAHAGNRFPSEFDPRPLTDSVAERAGEEGLVGVFAFDVAATDDGYKLIECNPRPTGATYPTAVAERLEADEWLNINVPTNKNLEESLRLLNEAELIYDPSTKTGAVVVNWATAGEGKLGILFAGPESTQHEQYKTARRLLEG